MTRSGIRDRPVVGEEPDTFGTGCACFNRYRRSGWRPARRVLTAPVRPALSVPGGRDDLHTRPREVRTHGRPAAVPAGPGVGQGNAMTGTVTQVVERLCLSLRNSAAAGL